MNSLADNEIKGGKNKTGPEYFLRYNLNKGYIYDMIH